MDGEKEVVGYYPGGSGPAPVDDIPLRRITVTMSRTVEQDAVFEVPADLPASDVYLYLDQTFDYLGEFEIFDQSRFVVRDACVDSFWEWVES